MKAGAESLQGGRRYRIRDAGEFGLMLEMCEAETWHGLYSFERIPRRRVDFDHANYYLSTAPDSFFVQNRVCVIATREGEKMLFNGRLRIRTGEGVAETEVGDGDDYLAVLREHFGITLPRDAELKPFLWA